MPHCIVEYSHGLTDVVDPQTINKAVFEGALKSALFEQNHIKTRSSVYQHYQTGSEKSEFVHVVMRILSGRTAEQRAHLSGLVLESLAALQLTSVSLTVEVVEMERFSYAKLVV